MIHPLPPGTRDVLPEEMRELRLLTERLRGVFESAGHGRHRIGVGDGSLYRTLLEAFEVPEEERMPLLEDLSRRDLVGIEARVDRLGFGRAVQDALVRTASLRGGPEVLDHADGAVH